MADSKDTIADVFFHLEALRKEIEVLRLQSNQQGSKEAEEDTPLPLTTPPPQAPPPALPPRQTPAPADQQLEEERHAKSPNFIDHPLFLTSAVKRKSMDPATTSTPEAQGAVSKIKQKVDNGTAPTFSKLSLPMHTLANFYSGEQLPACPACLLVINFTGSLADHLPEVLDCSCRTHRPPGFKGERKYIFHNARRAYYTWPTKGTMWTRQMNPDHYVDNVKWSPYILDPTFPPASLHNMDAYNRSKLLYEPLERAAAFNSIGSIMRIAAVLAKMLQHTALTLPPNIWDILSMYGFGKSYTSLQLVLYKDLPAARNLAGPLAASQEEAARRSNGLTASLQSRDDGFIATSLRKISHGTYEKPAPDNDWPYTWDD